MARLRTQPLAVRATLRERLRRKFARIDGACDEPKPSEPQNDGTPPVNDQTPSRQIRRNQPVKCDGTIRR